MSNKKKKVRRILKPYQKVKEWDSPNNNCVNCKRDSRQKRKNKQNSSNKHLKLKQKKAKIKERKQ